MAKQYHTLHNPLFYFIHFQSSLRTVIFMAFNIISFSNRVLLFYMFSVVPQYLLLQCLPSHLFFYSTASSVSGFSAAICSYHTYEWASIQSFVSAPTPQSSAAVPAPVQSQGLSLSRKAIHFIVHLSVKCCSVGQPLSAEAECSDGKCCCIFEL